MDENDSPRSIADITTLESITTKPDIVGTERQRPGETGDAQIIKPAEREEMEEVKLSETVGTFGPKQVGDEIEEKHPTLFRNDFSETAGNKFHRLLAGASSAATPMILMSGRVDEELAIDKRIAADKRADGTVGRRKD